MILTNNTLKKTLFFCLLGLVCQTAFAQNWTGAVSSEWNNAANWSTPPSNGAAVTISPTNFTGGSFAPVITANSTFTVSSMLVSNGAVLTIGGNLTTTDDVEVLNPNSEIIVNQGAFNVNVSNGGRLIADLGGKITVNGGNVTVGERLISGFDAQITVFNGSVSTGERLLMDLGGKIILNGGNLSAGQVMALADGDVNGSSYFEQNGGTLTVTGEVALENEAGNFEPTILITGGTFILNGDLVWFGSAPGIGTPRFITNGGTVNINGNISNLPLSTVNLFLDIKGTSQFNFNGAAIDLLLATDSIKQSGSSTIQLLGTHNWTNPGVFYAENGLVLCNGTTNLLGTGIYQFNNLSIASAKTLNHVNPFDIFVKGDFSKLGSFNAASNKVTFNGISTQLVSGAATLNLSSLEVNNSLEVTLNLPVTVSNTLTLTNGVLNTSNLALLTLSSTANATSGSNLSYVAGPMKKVGNSAFVFPLGRNGNWRRLGISAPTSSTSEFVAEYFDTPANNTMSFNSPLNAVSNLEFWQLEKSIPADAPIIELYWENASLSGISDCAATTIARYNGSAWDNVNTTSSGNCSGNGNGTSISNSPQTDLGFFTFGYFGNVVAQTITICNGTTFTVGSSVYNSTGNYIDVLTDINNNDSTVITNLTVLPDLVLNQNIQICAGETYSIGNSTYSAAGVYSDLLVSVNGCDSVVNTTLTIANVIDVSTTNVDAVFAAVNTNASGYQWLDCNANFSAISGETLVVFTPSANGSYAVEISEGVCKDTSACILLTDLNIYEESNFLASNVFPNPTNGLITVTQNGLIEKNIEIYNSFGSLILTLNSVNEDVIIDLSKEPKGLYIIKASSSAMNEVLKLVVQ